jgi:hypothetical protein
MDEEIKAGSERFREIERLLIDGGAAADVNGARFLSRMRNLHAGECLWIREWSTAGTYQWTCPPGVREALSVGRGGDARDGYMALVWISDRPQ